MDTHSRKDDVFGSLSALVLLIGTATGSAKAIMILSGIVLVLMVLIGRTRIGRGALLAALVAAVTAFVIGAVLALEHRTDDRRPGISVIWEISGEEISGDTIHIYYCIDAQNDSLCQIAVQQGF